MALFKQLSSGMDNVTVHVSIRQKSEILTAKNDKKYFWLTCYDGVELKNITIFNDTYYGKIDVNKTYKITGISVKFDKNGGLYLSCSHITLEEMSTTFEKEYGNVQSIVELDGDVCNIMGVCTEIREPEDKKTRFGICKLYAIKIRDKTGSIIVKKWKKGFDTKQGDSLLLENVSISKFQNTIECMVTSATVIHINNKATNELKQWYEKDGKTTSTINISVSARASTSQINSRDEKDKPETQSDKNDDKKGKKKRKLSEILDALSDDSDEDLDLEDCKKLLKKLKKKL